MLVSKLITARLYHNKLRKFVFRIGQEQILNFHHSQFNCIIYGNIIIIKYSFELDLN